MTEHRNIGSTVRAKNHGRDVLLLLLLTSLFVGFSVPRLPIASGLPLLGHICIGLMALIFLVRVSPTETVAMDDNCLYVSGFGPSVAISLELIASAKEGISRSRAITIEFFEPTPIGTQLTFIPRIGNMRSVDGVHPLVADFRNLASHNHARRRE